MKMRPWPSLLVALAVAATSAAAAEPPVDGGAEPPPAAEGAKAAVVEPAAAAARRPDAPLEDFFVQVDDLIIPHDVFGIYAMPGEALQIEVVTQRSDHAVEAELRVDAGAVDALSANHWRYRVPDEVGVYPAVISDPAGGERVRLNVFVKRPLDEQNGEYLRGYRIGAYPAEAWKDNPRYQPPRGLIEVTEALRDTLIAPNFRIGQFLTKQEGGWPRYVALQERLLLKLQMILEAVQEAGVDADTFFIMSGYRTPFYNRAIGNVPNSRHVFGDAADIFVDVDRDGRMDDLDGDGDSDFDDADWLAGVVKELTDSPWYQPLVGGLGRYGPRPHRGPFVHVDTRGYPARWDTP